MKTTIRVCKPVEMMITHIRINLPVRYEEEDIPNGFPGRIGDTWEAMIQIDTGRIVNWPKGHNGHLHMKVCDGGTYELGSYYEDHWESIAKIDQDYVPHGVVPGEYGDYVDLIINEEGIITNWPKNPNVSRFFKQNE